RDWSSDVCSSDLTTASASGRGSPSGPFRCAPICSSGWNVAPGMSSKGSDVGSRPRRCASTASPCSTTCPSASSVRRPSKSQRSWTQGLPPSPAAATSAGAPSSFGALWAGSVVPVHAVRTSSTVTASGSRARRRGSTRCGRMRGTLERRGKRRHSGFLTISGTATTAGGAGDTRAHTYDGAMSDGLFEVPGHAPRTPAGSLAGNTHASAPLAVRMRPRTLDELVGQQHLLAPGSPLRRLIEGDQPMSLLLWGPPGVGKTTIASIVSQQTDRHFAEVSAVAAGVKEVRAAIDAARSELVRTGRETVLFVDEVHRFSKAQQDALLPGVENRWVSLVAATTENPFFSVISPLLSRSLLLTLEPLTDDDIRQVVRDAVADERGLAGSVRVDDAALDQLVRLAGGDARRSLTYLEAAAGAATSDGAGDDGVAVVDLATVERAVDRAAVRYD